MSYDAVLNLIVAIFGDGASKKAIKFKWGHEGGALIQLDYCAYTKTHQKTHPEPSTFALYHVWINK